MAEASTTRERIEKLLALADPARNPDQGEATAAYLSACALMRKEHLGLRDFGESRVVDRVVTVPAPAKPCAWCDRFERRLGDIIAKLSDEPLTEWESSFVRSLRDQLRRRRRLSDKQIEVLKRIAEDHEC